MTRPWIKEEGKEDKTLRLEGDAEEAKTNNEESGEKEGESEGEGESGKKRKREDDEIAPETEGILIEKIDEGDREVENENIKKIETENENNEIKSTEETLDPSLESQELLDNKNASESSEEKTEKKSDMKSDDVKNESSEIEKTKIVPANVPVVSTVRTFPARQTGLTDRWVRVF